MANSFKQISGNLEFKVRRMKADLPDAIGLMAKQHFQGNFTRQGFDDTKWVESKRRTSGKGRDKTRATLSGKTGMLKKSIHVDKATWNKIVIATDRLAYAKIHNEGGTINKKESTKVLHFRSVEMDYNKKTKTHGKGTKFSTYKRAHYSQKVNIGAHSIVIPKRQYMGDSPMLMARINKLITNTINKAFKS